MRLPVGRDVVLALKLEHKIPEFRGRPSGDAVHSGAHDAMSVTVSCAIGHPKRPIRNTVWDGVLITSARAGTRPGSC
jgi:hypothetical protein